MLSKLPCGRPACLVSTISAVKWVVGYSVSHRVHLFTYPERSKDIKTYVKWIGSVVLDIGLAILLSITKKRKVQMNLIVVVDNQWGIGRNNGLLFRLKKDMASFREHTTGKIVVMGERTLASFPKGPLPNRVNVVLDSSGAQHDGTITVDTVEKLFDVLESYDTDDVYVIGGASVYRLLLNNCKTAYVTKVDDCGDAQLFFPNLDELPNWKQVEQSAPIDDEGHVIRFCKYVNNAI